MEVFLGSIATEEYESMASALVEMGATDTNIDSKAFARDLEKMFSSIKASIKFRFCPNCVLLSKIILLIIVLVLGLVKGAKDHV